jgi:hypothetical protein
MIPRIVTGFCSDQCSDRRYWPDELIAKNILNFAPRVGDPGDWAPAGNQVRKSATL